MMNQTDSQLNSINEEKPLSLDQQQHEITEMKNEEKLPLSLDQQQHETNNAVDSHASSSRDYSKGPNLPVMDLLTGPRERYLEIGVPLYKASIKGDSEAAKRIFDKNPELVRCSITQNAETSLHVAASSKSSKEVENFVKNLVKLMSVEDLALENRNYITALYLAASGGNIKTVITMMEMNENLRTILGVGSENLQPIQMPLFVAALYGHNQVVKYLYEKSNDFVMMMVGHMRIVARFFRDAWRLICLFKELSNSDIALKVVVKYPKLGSNLGVLAMMAQKPEAFEEEESNRIERIINSLLHGFSVIGLKKEPKALQLLKLIWNDMAKMTTYELTNIFGGPSPILFVAAELGNTKFIIEYIRQFPDFTSYVNINGHTIFHIAVKHRHEGIYNLLYEIGSMKDSITPIVDNGGNNMLHLAAMSTKKKRLEDVSGAALKMQRELLWFKEVESIMPPSHRLRKNKAGLTPRELFTEEHQHLMIQGEEWMKSTASQCMVVAALIATIVFAAAFTVPGGYNQNNGIPMFNRKLNFVVFVVADALSLFLSSASILTFLSILTSRYAERDFVRSLPMKLMLGLSTLFLSITTMMITFGVSFFVLYHNEMKWIPISIGVFAVMPVVLYVVLQYHLLIDVIRSAYGGMYLFKPMKQVLYYKNPSI